MDGDRAERTLRAHFQRQRSEEERAAPRFDPLLRAAGEAAKRAPRPALSWVRFAGAAAVAAGVVLALKVNQPGNRLAAPDAERWSALSQWSAPTDSFLQWPASQVGSVTIEAPSDIWLRTTKESGGQKPTAKEK